MSSIPCLGSGNTLTHVALSPSYSLLLNSSLDEKPTSQYTVTKFHSWGRNLYYGTPLTKSRQPDADLLRIQLSINPCSTSLGWSSLMPVAMLLPHLLLDTASKALPSTWTRHKSSASVLSMNLTSQKGRFLSQSTYNWGSSTLSRHDKRRISGSRTEIRRKGKGLEYIQQSSSLQRLQGRIDRYPTIFAASKRPIQAKDQYMWNVD